MREHEEMTKNNKSRFKGPYKYCSIMDVGEKFTHDPHLSEPMDPVWSDPLKKRPDSPPTVYKKDKLEDFIDRNKTQAVKRTLLTDIEVEFLKEQYIQKVAG